MRGNVLALVACASLFGCGTVARPRPVLVVPTPASTPPPAAASTLYLYGLPHFSGPVRIEPGYEAAVTSPPTATLGARPTFVRTAVQSGLCTTSACLGDLVAVLKRYCSRQTLDSDDLTTLYNSHLEPVPPGSKSPCTEFPVS